VSHERRMLLSMVPFLLYYVYMSSNTLCASVAAWPADEQAVAYTAEVGGRWFLLVYCESR
jgi:hypothetical protein